MTPTEAEALTPASRKYYHLLLGYSTLGMRSRIYHPDLVALLTLINATIDSMTFICLTYTLLIVEQFEGVRWVFVVVQESLCAWLRRKLLTINWLRIVDVALDEPVLGIVSSLLAFRQ